MQLSSNIFFNGFFALSRATSLETRLGITSITVFAQNSSSTLRFEFVYFLRYARLPFPYRPEGDHVCSTQSEGERPGQGEGMEAKQDCTILLYEK